MGKMKDLWAKQNGYYRINSDRIKEGFEMEGREGTIIYKNGKFVTKDKESKCQKKWRK